MSVKRLRLFERCAVSLTYTVVGKKMRAKTIAALAFVGMLIPTIASAATIQGVATYDGTQWVIAWDGVSPVCASDFFAVSFANLDVRIDGTDYAVTQDGMEIDAILNRNSVSLPASVPNGAFQSFTINGATSLPCDGHTFLMPPAAVAAVPTLSEWGMILFAIILAGGAALHIQHRRQTA